VNESYLPVSNELDTKMARQDQSLLSLHDHASEEIKADKRLRVITDDTEKPISTSQGEVLRITNCDLSDRQVCLGQRYAN
jgi:hypothetical protein